MAEIKFPLISVSPFYENAEVRRNAVRDIINQRQEFIAKGHTAINDAKAGVFRLINDAAGTHLSLVVERKKYIESNGSPISINRPQLVKAIAILLSVLELHDLAVIEQEKNKDVD